MLEEKTLRAKARRVVLRMLRRDLVRIALRMCLLLIVCLSRYFVTASVPDAFAHVQVASMNKWRETHYQILRLRVVIERMMNVKLLRALNRWVILFIEDC